ncbi:MAG TPA: radical SAM protein [Methanomicrobia archaeon]|nr:radical SAM protein [Methanomicrobia archaeon]HEX58798.1 radical SAM protein [Methanomicrobia archaeon]
MLIDINTPSHCIFCEGLDTKIKNPKHHPSYEITAACNLNCIFCYSRVAAEAGAAPREGYYGDENPKAITISQYGEPLFAGAHRLISIIKGLRRKFGDVRIDLQTNGTLLDEKSFSGLEPLVDIVMVSMSAATPQTYAKITGGGAREFKAALKALELVGRSDDVLGVARAVYCPGINDDELPKLAALIESLGVDELMIQPCTVYAANEERLRAAGFDFESSSRIFEILEVASACKRAAPSLRVGISGCILAVFKQLLDNGVSPEDLRFLRRDARAGALPQMKRMWRFSLNPTLV